MNIIVIQEVILGVVAERSLHLVLGTALDFDMKIAYIFTIKTPARAGASPNI